MKPAYTGFKTLKETSRRTFTLIPSKLICTNATDFPTNAKLIILNFLWKNLTLKLTFQPEFQIFRKRESPLHGSADLWLEKRRDATRLVGGVGRKSVETQSRLNPRSRACGNIFLTRIFNFADRFPAFRPLEIIRAPLYSASPWQDIGFIPRITVDSTLVARSCAWASRLG